MWLNANLGKVHLETCWLAVYLVGRSTHSQGLLIPVTHMFAGPALLHFLIVEDQLQASLLPSPLSLGKYVPCCLYWFSSVTSAVVLGAMDTTSVDHYCI